MQMQYSVIGQTEPASADGPKKAYPIKRAMDFLQVSRPTLYRMAARGELKIIRVGGRAFIPATEIERLVTEGTAA